jgi:integrase
LTKYLGDVPVDGYTRRDAKALYELLGTSGRGKKFVTVNRLFAFLRAAVSFAINDDVLPPTYANPFRGWKRVPERPREEVLGDKQLGAFLAAFDRLEDPVVRNYLRLLGSTGQRPGELRRILWDDVVLDGERPQFTIRCSKNHRDVEVPIDASEVIHFRELLKYRLAGNPHVFPSRIRARKGVEEPQPMPAPNRVWRALRSAAGFPGLHMHDLKATALTNLARAGFTTEMLMQHGNHADASTTMRYVRLAKDSANRDKIRDARAEIIAKARQSAMPRDGATVTDIGQAREARAG